MSARRDVDVVGSAALPADGPCRPDRRTDPGRRLRSPRRLRRGGAQHSRRARRTCRAGPAVGATRSRSTRPAAPPRAAAPRHRSARSPPCPPCAPCASDRAGTPRVEEASAAAMSYEFRATRAAPPLLRAAQHRRVHRSERGPPRGLGLVHSGHADVGAATTAALLFVGLFDPVSTLRVGVTLGAPVSEGRPEVSPGRPAEGIAVRGVRYRYGDGPDVLHGIDLDLRAGQRLPSSARPARASPRRRA
ncbi:hypothetical protein HEP81_00939 [Streptomyces griseofuscus]|uniref:Uncharacterized protein n=1 Tax=Streptomyces griseofuscus TaxID=146922 RepID=A0A7H1PT93_9ACTN|nr:hypothetical protein HEP81_00939 [Streptomyces griseofuscus]